MQDVEEFSDTSSGAKFSRDGLDALMRGVRKGRIDAVVAYKLDRLRRSYLAVDAFSSVFLSLQRMRPPPSCARVFLIAVRSRFLPLLVPSTLLLMQVRFDNPGRVLLR
jgi:hypothetical protein